MSGRDLALLKIDASDLPVFAVGAARTGVRIGMARVAKQLRQRGYRKVRILDGGLEAWVAAGLPTESNESVEAAGTKVQ